MLFKYITFLAKGISCVYDTEQNLSTTSEVGFEFVPHTEMKHTKFMNIFYVIAPLKNKGKHISAM